MASACVGYGWMVLAIVRSPRRPTIASVSSEIISPAWAATIVAPRNPVPPRLDDHLDEPFVLAVEDGPVHVVQLLREGAERDALLPGLVFVQADMGDLRVGVGTPRHGQR